MKSEIHISDLLKITWFHTNFVAHCYPESGIIYSHATGFGTEEIHGSYNWETPCFRLHKTSIVDYDNNRFGNHRKKAY